jgi:DNA topoisomerase-3
VLHEKGIGTPATRADIIENLISKSYVVRVGKAMRPTVKGIRMIDTLRRIHVDRLTSPELTGELELHLRQVEKGSRSKRDFMSEIADYTVEIVDRAKGFSYDELYDANDVLGNCPACGRPVIEMAWFYRCKEEPPRDPDCTLRIWKDTSGRYIDRASVRVLLRDGKTGVIDGFTARDGRTYRGVLEIVRDDWTVAVRSAGWNEDATSADPEFEVNPEPLGRCPFEEDCSIVESPTQFVCERKLKEAELSREERARAAAEGGPQSCGFVLPRTVCKREITREEALHYVAEGKTPLLTDFTSRFGRPFSATLVLKENGRHGFEFPPRKARGAAAADGGEAAAATPELDAAARAARPRKRSSRGRTAGTARSAKKKSAGKGPVEVAPAAKPRTLLRRKKAGSVGSKAPAPSDE